MTRFGKGQPAARLEDQRLLTGEGRYTDDLAAPDALALFVLRSPEAHAEIRGLDVDAARAAPGVVLVLTGEDVEADGIGDVPCMVPVTNRDGSKRGETPHPPLARGRVRHGGEAVAVIVADTASHAQDAAELIEVDYAPLPTVVGTEAAAGEGAPALWPDIADNVVFDWEKGDAAATDAAFAKAAQVAKLRLENNRVVANSMEMRPILAAPQSDGRLTVHSSTQGPAFIRAPLAKALGMDAKDLRCVTTDVGGGFGMKVFLYPEHVLVAWAARRLGRAVRYQPSRGEAFVSDAQGRDHVTYAEAALDADGVMQAIRVTTYANMGAYLSNFGPYIPTDSGVSMTSGCYRVPAVYVNVKGVVTNTVPTDAYRGAGRPEAAYLVERLIEVAGHEMGLAPDEIRRRNFIGTDQMPYRTPLGNTYDSGDFAGVMARGMEMAGWAGFEARREEAAARGRLRGIGMAVYIERCGGGNPLPARVAFNEDDTLTVFSGTQSNGQGHETSFTQILSGTLGIDAERIRVVQGDTDVTPPGFTGGSRSMPVGGSAVLRAAERVVAKGRLVAAGKLEAAPSDVEFDDGEFRVAGTDLRMSLFDVARAANDPALVPDGETPGLDCEEAFTPEEATYPNGCHVCEVEIDPDTGVTTVVGYSICDDFGDVINPNLLAGQVHGGVAQGVGQALLEHTVYDPDSGQLLSGSFMDYTMPRADLLPPIAFETRNIPCANNPLGLKGAGEAGTIGAPPAVVNAVVDALRARTGLVHADMPLTPARVAALLRGAPSGS